MTPSPDLMARFAALPQAARDCLLSCDGPGYVVCWYSEDKKWAAAPWCCDAPTTPRIILDLQRKMFYEMETELPRRPHGPDPQQHVDILGWWPASEVAWMEAATPTPTQGQASWTAMPGLWRVVRDAGPQHSRRHRWEIIAEAPTAPACALLAFAARFPKEKP